MRNPERASLKDIAKLAKVSIRTVSRVVNNSPLVNEETRHRVSKAIQELNYRPHEIARRLSTGTSKTIGLFVPFSTDYVAGDLFFLDIILGISKILNKEDYDLQIFTIDDANQNEDFYLNLYRERRIEGMILTTPCVDDHLVLDLLRHDIPFVLIGRPNEGVLCDYVDNDNVKATSDLIDYLAGLGHSKIAIIAGPPNLTVTQDRIAGYKLGHKLHGLDYVEDYICLSLFTCESGEKETQRLLQLPEPPTAIITGNDFLAVGAITGAKRMGKKIPADLSIISFNDTPLAAYYDPPITTVRAQIMELATKTAEMLLAKLKKTKQKERVVIIPCELVERSSCSAITPRNRC